MKEQQSSARRFWLAGKRAAEQDRFFREALEARGWQEGDEAHWDAAWVTGMPEPEQFRRVSPQRWLNHFPGNAALTVKSRLHESLSSLRARVKDGFGAEHPLASRLDFFPRAYVMPHDYHALQQAARDDPAQRWILKPTNASKGKGVRVLRDVTQAPLAPDWLVQEYLDRPHTIRGHKYVLRLYVLITSLTPLRVYLYRQGFAKLASEPWDPDDADNPYSQLTNPDINALNVDAEVPVEFIDLDRYRAWLRDQGHDDASLFARIEDLVALTAIAGVDAMRSRTAAVGADPRGCYELLGLDCMIDDSLKPWILECNLSPSLGICAAPEDGGRIEEQVKGDLVRDLISLVGIGSEDSATQSAEADAVTEAEQELARAGGFRRLLPAADPERYLAFFSLPTPSDLELADALAGKRVSRPRLTRRQVSEFYDDHRLALYAPATGRLYQPNDSAALIWLLATEGLEPDAIAEALSSAAGETDAALDVEAQRQEVWDTLAEWCRLGLLCQGAAEEVEPRLPGEPAAAPELRTPSPALQQLEHDGRHWLLQVADAAVMRRVQAAFGERLSSLQPPTTAALPQLSLWRAPAGYALAADGALLASRLTLPAAVPALVDYLLRQAASSDQPVLDVAVLTSPKGQAALCVAADEQSRDALTELAPTLGAGLARGVRLTGEGESVRCEPLGLPWATATTAMADALPGELPLMILVSELSEADSMAPMNRLDALAALLPTLRTPGGEPPTARQVQTLDHWLERRPSWKVGIDTAAARLGASLDAPDRETSTPAAAVSAGE